MILRRFPWKAPRMSDNSYRLFVSPPDPDQDKLLYGHRGSASARNSVTDAHRGSQSEPASRNPSGNDAGEDHKHHHRHHDDASSQQRSKSESVSRQSTQSEQATIKGPLRLLRLLPRETRHIIGRMLELDPTRRATMDEILQDPWVQNSLVCRQEEGGRVVKAPNHTHTLQPSNPTK